LGLFQANLALVYFSAFAAKLTLSGTQWARGEIFRAYLIERYFQTGSAITHFVAGQPKLCAVLSTSMLLFEGLFWLVLVSRRARSIFAPLGVAIHIAVYFIMGINFMKIYMLGYLAFVPFERLLGARRAEVQMNTARPLWPAAVLGVFILIQGYADIFRINHWPLSDYPMFAYPRKLEDASGFRLRAEKAGGEMIDIPVLGGAATMFIYNGHIETGNFESLRPQMVSDARDHFQAKGSLGEMAELAKLHLQKLRAVQNSGSGFQIEATTVYSFDPAELPRASSASFK
jgi:hypothetical protein